VIETVFDSPLACASCGRPVALLFVNGQSIRMEAELVVQGPTFVLSRHTCSVPAPAPIPEPAASPEPNPDPDSRLWFARVESDGDAILLWARNRPSRVFKQKQVKDNFRSRFGADLARMEAALNSLVCRREIRFLHRRNMAIRGRPASQRFELVVPNADPID
jgi:hypothetical protein